MEAARALGATRWRVLISHALPNGMAPVLALATLGVGNAITLEAGLSFLGLGMPLVAENRLAGQAIEAMIGLPPGSWLEIAIFGEGPYGGVEVVWYGGVESRDLTPLARPPNTGLLDLEA